MTDHERLTALLKAPGTERLLARLRDRFEKGGGVDGQVELRDVSDEERTAVCRILGRRPSRSRSLQVRLTELDRVIRNAALAPDLRAAVAAVSGPLRDRPTERAASARAWQAVFARAERAASERPELAAWTEELTAGGLLKRSSQGRTGRARELLERALRVVALLPAEQPGVTRQDLAARAVGDAHALDPDRSLETLVVRAARILGGMPDGRGAMWRRDVWDSVGVLAGELSRPVLTFNLPGDDVSATGRTLAIWREAGQPVYLSRRQLVASPPALAVEASDVFVCENPAVVAAAVDRIGRPCPPLVCVSGHPSVASLTLLARLRQAGARLRYHGDFDWAGIAIGNQVIDRFAARPWRFDAAAYRHAADAGVSDEKLDGAALAARWDAALAPAMSELGVKIEEECVLEALLADLLAGAASD